MKNTSPLTSVRTPGRSVLGIVLTCLALLSLLGMGASPYLAKATKTPKSNAGSSAYDVINLVNQLRQANGLTPYQINSALMASAQAHSDYQASIRSITHTGSGGSSAKSRAMSAGYGGGAAVFVSENIYGGTGASAQQAVTWWQGDSPHLNTMLGGSYVDAGAGVATDGSVVYYTLDVGYISGSPGSGSTTVPTSIGATSISSTAVTFYPVQIATPQADGSIVHVVQPGQTLWTIAAAYKVSLPDLMSLNGFTSSTVIYPGNEVLIQPPSLSATPVITTTLVLTPTIPAITPTASVYQTVTKTVSPTLPTIQPPQQEKPKTNSPAVDPLLLIIAFLVCGGAILVVLGNVLKRNG
ncbi:MAG: LysM peptidoglycan-binding domain-containing protein [Anaerolineales bacterium]|nr:LysM peptidoglycan-binding domain-containing protein [Anaerolineales bacterium]